MKLPRMTMRRWMVVVAVTALIMGVVAEGIRELRLGRQYREMAYGYRLAEDLNRGEQVTLSGGMTVQSVGSPTLAAYYADLRRKYEHASRYPWLRVEPDPPLPKW